MVLRDTVEELSAQVADISHSVSGITKRVESAAAIAHVAILKITVLTELRYFGHQAHARMLTPIVNTILAMDLPEKWWMDRVNATIGEWWMLVNVSEAEFRAAHGIE